MSEDYGIWGLVVFNETGVGRFAHHFAAPRIRPRLARRWVLNQFYRRAVGLNVQFSYYFYFGSRWLYRCVPDRLELSMRPRTLLGVRPSRPVHLQRDF